jgi:hypothetical protein
MAFETTTLGSPFPTWSDNPTLSSAQTAQVLALIASHPTVTTHELASTSGLGTYHTVSGLTAGQFLIATSATGAAFQSLGTNAIPEVNRSYLNDAREWVTALAPMSITITELSGEIDCGYLGLWDQQGGGTLGRIKYDFRSTHDGVIWLPEPALYDGSHEGTICVQCQDWSETHSATNQCNDWTIDRSTFIRVWPIEDPDPAKITGIYDVACREDDGTPWAGRELTLYNLCPDGETQYNLTLVHNSTDSTDGYRILCPSAADLVLAPGESARFIYDKVSHIWVVTAVSRLSTETPTITEAAAPPAGAGTTLGDQHLDTSTHTLYWWSPTLNQWEYFKADGQY